MADRKRLINDLRVIDLRAELEKRNLEKTGVRGVLIQRLSKYLEEQGEDPATFTFEQKLDSEAMEKSPVKQTRRSSSKAEQESCDNPVESEDADNNDILDLGDDELLNEEAENDDKEKENQEKDDAGEETAVADAAAADGGADADAVADADADADAATDPQDTPDPAAASGQSEDKDNDKDDKADTEKESESKKSGALNLWVSGLSSATRAKDLKLLCNKHGKVIAAKVVTSARTPGSRCYGYVTMASAEDVENCIKVLHKTELHGRIISVEKAKSEDAGRARTRDEDGEKGEEKPRKDEEPPSVRRSTSRTREKSHRSDKDRESQMRIRASRLARARAERAERARAERRRAADAALRERERAQRDERRRLEVEREKLRAEREKIEREKNELLQLERERQKLEREKLELERLELKRAQLRLEEERRKRYDAAPAYRKPSPPQYRDKRDPPAAYKPTARQYSPPPPPRFDPKDRREREYERAREPDYKRTYSRPVVSNPVKYTTNGAAKYEARPPPPVVARPKETGRASSREPRPAPYRAPEKPDPRWAATAARYPDAAAHKGAPPPRYTQETRPAAYTAYPAPTYYTQTREYRKY